ncbi:MAG: sulfatase [Chlorobi bacterium]|nr:sulfatase [Chlorobiota bacterium]
MFRIHYLLFFVVLVLFSCQNKKKEQQRPNILYIMSDDHGYQAISAYDQRYINTPNIDRIANEGVLFTNSFVSNSICGPSRAVLLTGKHCHINGFKENKGAFDGSQQTFPKLLQKAGYTTAIVGKWHLKSDPTGFDYWNILPGQGAYYNPDFIEMGKKKRYEGYAPYVTTDIAIDWLENKRDKSKPFCLLLHHKAVHRTWEPDTADFVEFYNKQYPVPDNYFDDYATREAAAAQKMSIRKPDMDIAYDLKMEYDGVKSRFKWFRTHTGRMTPEQKTKWDEHYQKIQKEFMAKDLKGKEYELWKYQRFMQDYLACVRSMDNSIGEVLDYLDEHGLTDNTIVIYTSDQGFWLGEHGWFDKRFMYEQSFRTPLMMRYPGHIKPGTKCDKLVQNIDYAPTFLDLAGVPIPDDIQGVSLTPLWEEKNPEWRGALYYHYYEFPNEHMVKRHYGIRTKRYKLIHFYNDIDEWEFFDLEKDPEEMLNQYDNTEYADVIKDLKKQLNDLQVQYKDTDRSTY